MIVLLLLLLLSPRPALAHSLKFSDSELTLRGSEALWHIRVHAGDFDLKFSRANEAALREYLPERLTLSAGGESCIFQKLDWSRQGESVTLNLFYHCPQSRPPLQVHYDLFYGDPSHRHLLKAEAFGKIDSRAFSAGNIEASFGEAGLSETILSFLKLGLEHILLGYDHILFVLTLILGARRLKNLLWLATSFTLAHSITLALATLNLVQLSPTLVEPAIAASIVFLAVLDLRTPEGQSPKGMIYLTFLFGLIHGLGFSYILKEAHLQAGNLAVPLIFFNLGVELGQLSVIAAIYPLTRLLAKLLKGAYPYLQRATLGVIAAIALYWLAQRIFG
ncbi:MAG TPA: hypothetical protein DF383_00065 [Deltaproteobacteria bacterium]|nr:hypothetical protein [Deltaproteobacteria bacterium]